MPTGASNSVVSASHPELGDRFLYCDGATGLLFTENETNSERLFHAPNLTPYVKDGINDYIVHGRETAVNPQKIGTKAAAIYRLTLGAREFQAIRLRFSDVAPKLPGLAREYQSAPFGVGFDALMQTREGEADTFFATVIPSSLNADAARVMRQALAGMLWSKQFYYYDVDAWLKEHDVDPFKAGRTAPRNDHWHHMYNADIISMPDKWEYPWYAAWDLAFHVLASSSWTSCYEPIICIPTASYPRTNGTSVMSTRPFTRGQLFLHTALKWLATEKAT